MANSRKTDDKEKEDIEKIVERRETGRRKMERRKEGPLLPLFLQFKLPQNKV